MFHVEKLQKQIDALLEGSSPLNETTLALLFVARQLSRIADELGRLE